MIGSLYFHTYAARKKLQRQCERVAGRRCGAGTLQAALGAAQATITSSPTAVSEAQPLQVAGRAQ
jgi:hypothetical protein